MWSVHRPARCKICKFVVISVCDVCVCVCVCLQELVAAEWVGLLRHGALDGAVHPDKARVIVDMLWTATAHGSPKVCALTLGCLYASSQCMQPW